MTETSSIETAAARSMENTLNTQGDRRLEAPYDREAAVYDAKRYNTREGVFFDRLEGEMLCDSLAPLSGKHVLDVPAGTGRSSLALARAGARVTALDISANMLRCAQDKAEREGLASIEFRKASAFELPFDDNHFDAVTSFKFFHLLDEPEKLQAISEMRRVLRPGGKLIAEFNNPYYGGVLAFYRYYFRKQQPGGMRKKCLFSAQVRRYFDGLNVVERIGVKFPFAGEFSRVSGLRVMLGLNHRIGRVPIVRQLCYGMMIVAEKPMDEVSR